MCHIDGKPLKVFENKEGILVIRNGKAGTTFYLRKGDYTITDHAYILYLKEPIKYEINLKWLMYELRNTFLEYSSSADNGTWNKTGFFNNVMLDLPIMTEQLSTITIYDKLENLHNDILTIQKDLEEIL